MIEVAAPPRVVVVSVGVDPVDAAWSPPWSALPAAGLPGIAVNHFSASATHEASPAQREIARSDAVSHVRGYLARIRTEAQARAGKGSGAYVWDIKGDLALMEALTHCDVMLSRDTRTDAALRQLSDLAEKKVLVRSDGGVGVGSISIWSALKSWHDLLGEFQGTLEPPVDRAVLGHLVSAWTERASRIAGALVPPQLAPVGATLELMINADYWATGEGGDDVVRRIGLVLLGGGPSWANGSLRALDQVIGLRRESRAFSEPDLQASTAQALGAAESARRRGEDSAARCHALIAVSLVTHRSRHPQRISSTLVTHTSDLVDPLRRDPTLRGLTDASTPRPGAGLVARGGRDTAPSVVLLPGPFGEFHRDMVAALSQGAAVTVSDLRQNWPELRRRRPIPQDLWLLSALREGRINLEENTLDGARIGVPSLQRAVRCLRRLKIELSHHDVAVSDWGDVITMWASHLCPKGTRLVTRWHSLDLFDPWIHLIDWRGIDTVLIGNSALGSLFTDLTRGTAAPPPVAVQPYLPDLRRFDQPKADGARFTIAMVGWGRLVKDPAFALDLLDRDSRRKLILIGPPFGPSVDARATKYADAFMARISSVDLKDRVRVVGVTDDVAGHLREAGIIVSSSFREGWHLGLIEGVASGAVPVVRDWPMLAARGGAGSIFPHDWVVSDVDQADARISALSDLGSWEASAKAAQAQIMVMMDPESAQLHYQEYVLGERLSAAGRSDD